MPTSEKKNFRALVSLALGYSDPMPPEVAVLVDKLEEMGYTVSGAARHVSKLLDINTL